MPESPQIKSSNKLQWLMRSPLGELIARSWLERPILYLLENWFFPLSRLWAAAVVAEGDVDKFFAAVPMPPVESKRDQVQGLLDNFGSRRRRILATEIAWRETFFGSRSCSSLELNELEKRRLQDRNEYNATRRQFAPLRKHVGSSVKACFSTPEQLIDLYGTNAAEDSKLFDLPTQWPEISVSQSIEKANSRDYWLSFDCPSERLGDTVFARVLEPLGVDNPPTLIFGHGIGVEFDHWRNLVDIVKFLPQLGIRVIRPESPWHGRRVPHGFYGGEYFLSSTPMSGFDFFPAQHKEWACLINWARSTSSGRVAIGGSSLGAQSAQMTAIRAKEWPAHLRPDALLLMAHCAHLWEVALDGDLADLWNLHAPLKQLGWSRRITEQWMQRLDPSGDPCMPPDNIVSVLGRSDDVTPYRSGRRLQKLWELPAQNCYSWPCGHFEVPLRMVRQPQPLFRLKEILSDD